jgi:hypothetical protein
MPRLLLFALTVFCSALAAAPGFATPRTVLADVNYLHTHDESGTTFVSATCYKAPTTSTGLCAGGGDFNLISGLTGTSCLAVADGGYIVSDGKSVLTGGPDCFLRMNFGLNGLVDARQCGVTGDGSTNDFAALNVCLTDASTLGIPAVTTGGGVVVDNGGDIVIPANITLTCGGNNASEALADDYRIRNSLGNIQLTNAIVIDPRYKISIPSSSQDAAFTGCNLEAGVGGSGIAHPNTYSPSVWYPNCDPSGSGCSGTSAYLRSAIDEQNAFYRDPSWNCSSGQDPNHPAGCSTGVAIAGDHATLRDVSILGFGTCYFVNNGEHVAVRPVIDHMAGDCDTGLSFLNSNGPKLNDFRIDPLLTGGADINRAFHIESIVNVSGQWQVNARIKNPMDHDTTFLLVPGDVVWVGPGAGYESTVGRWTIGNDLTTAPCTTGPEMCQKFLLIGSIATGISEAGTVNNVPSAGAPPTQISAINPPPEGNPNFRLVHV